MKQTSATVALSALVLSTTWYLQVPQQGTLEGRSLRLLDPNGRAYCEVQWTEAGPQLELSSPVGKRIVLGLMGDEAHFRVQNKERATQLAIECAGSRSSVVMNTVDGKNGIAFIVDGDDRSVALFDKQRIGAVGMSVHDDVRMLYLSPATGGEHSVIEAVAGQSGSSLRVQDAVSHQGIVVSTANGRSAMIEVLGEQGASHWRRGVSDGRSISDHKDGK